MNTSPTLERRMLTEAEVAEYLSLSRGYLRRLRMMGSATDSPGPPFHRLGGAIRYSIDDLDNWLAERRVVR